MRFSLVHLAGAVRLMVIALIALSSPLLATRALAQTRYGNIVNTHFATVSNGPQSSVIVDVSAKATDAQIAAIVSQRLLREWRREQSALAPQLGAGGKRAALPISTLVHVRKAGRLVTPAPKAVTRAFGGGTLTFTFENFNGAVIADNNGNAIVVETFLRQFLNAIYPRIAAVYGAPAVSGEVKVRSMGFFDNGSATEVQRLAFGAYNVSENRIYLPLYQSVDSLAHAFLLNVIHAFHGPAAFQYDAWEQGFARAAATVVARDLAPGFENQPLNFFDPTANNLYSLLPEYDILNQPPLANNTFFPPSQADIPIDGVFTFAKMLQARLGMSGAAWLKAYIESPSFFRDFNAAYYVSLDASSTQLAGNIPALKSIAANVLPQVEGIAFNDWYAQQHVLDTSVTTGNKLFAFVLPTENTTDSGQSTLIGLIYYRTKPTGDEELLGGRAYATYFDATNSRISLGSQSAQAQIENGEGFLTTLAFPNQGFDDGRITMDFSVGSQTARTYFAQGLSGDIVAAIVGKVSDGSAVSVNQTNIKPAGSVSKTTTTARSAFSVSVGSNLGDLARSTITVTDSGVTRTYKRNIGDGRNWLVLPPISTGAAITVSKSFPTAVPRLISLPVRPLASTVEQAFGLPATDFLLSSWDPQRSLWESVAPSTPSVGLLMPGRGYFFNPLPVSGGNVTLNINGVPPATDTDLSVAAPFGWVLVGTPFGQLLDVTQIGVKFLEQDVFTWDDAVANNLIAPQVFQLGDDGVYHESNVIDGAAWQGVWLRVYAPSGVTLLIPGPDSPGRSRATMPTRSAVPLRQTPAWAVRLFASVNGKTSSATLGAASGASRAVDPRWDVEAPPAIAPSLSLEFMDLKTAGGRMISDFRAPADANRGSWRLKLSSPTGGNIALGWGNLGSVPRGVSLTLRDEVTGQRIALGSRSGTVVALKAGESRLFTVNAEPARSMPIDFRGVQMIRGRGQGAIQVQYVLTADADVVAEIATLSGKPVRRLPGGRAQATQQRSVAWDGLGESGQPLPMGTYLLTLTARTDDGAQVKVTRPVTVIR